MPTVLSGPSVTAGTSLFRGLADRTRLGIIGELLAGERRVVDLARSLGLPQSSVSTHLACLRECGLVTARPEGRQMFYRLAVPTLADLLAAAETVLAQTGTAIELCPRFGAQQDGAEP